MALINPQTLEIPDVGVMFPTTRRRRNVKPCGTGAAYRRHYRRKGAELPVDPACAKWHRGDVRRHDVARRQSGKALRLEPGDTTENGYVMRVRDGMVTLGTLGGGHMARREHSQSGSTDRRAKSKSVQVKLGKQRGKNTDGSKKPDRSGRKGKGKK